MACNLERLSSPEARIAIVGGGKMGEACFGGWIGADCGGASAWSGANFTVVEPVEARRDYLSETYGVSCVESASQLDRVDMVLLSVKPQVLAGVLADLARLDFAPRALYVSIAAGFATSKIESLLPEGAHLVRVMPNVALMLGKGASTLCAGSCADADELEFVRGLFASVGKAFIVEEDQMDITTAINGSGPAYAAAMVEALADAAAEAGLDRQLAECLAAQTVYGSGALMAERGQTAERTRIDVSSPGGTTLAALDAMEQAGFSSSLHAGVLAAIRRSKELGA